MRAETEPDFSPRHQPSITLQMPQQTKQPVGFAPPQQPQQSTVIVPLQYRPRTERP